VTPLSRFRQGMPIRLEQGVLFTTYATLRSELVTRKYRGSNRSWNGWAADFDGVIIFDESHAMQNAAGGKGERGDPAASQQGRAGLRLQHPCRTRASSTSRRPAPPPFITSPTHSASGFGRRGLSVRDAQRVCRGDRGRRRRGDGGAGRAISRRLASMRRDRSPTKASNMNWSSIGSLTSKSVSMTPMPAPSRSSIQSRRGHAGRANITGARAR